MDSQQSRLEDAHRETRRCKQEAEEARREAQGLAGDIEKHREDYSILLSTVLSELPRARRDLQEGLSSADKATFMTTLSRLRESIRAHVAEREAKAAEAAAGRIQEQLRGVQASLNEKDALTKSQELQLRDIGGLQARVHQLEVSLESKEMQVAEMEQVPSPPRPHFPPFPALTCVEGKSPRTGNRSRGGRRRRRAAELPGRNPAIPDAHYLHLQMFAESQRELEEQTADLESVIREQEAAILEHQAAAVEREASYQTHLERSRAEADKAARLSQAELMVPLRAELERVKVRGSSQPHGIVGGSRRCHITKEERVVEVGKGRGDSRWTAGLMHHLPCRMRWRGSAKGASGRSKL